jgi:biotin transport system substrate-specific component
MPHLHPGSSPGTNAARLTKAGWNATDLSLIAVFAALLAASIAVPPIPAGNVLGVPLTLQTLVVTLTGLVLGAGRAAAAAGLYVAVGLAGLPVLSGFTGGLGVLAGGSAGYLLSFPLSAALVGLLTQLIIRSGARRRAVWMFAATLAGLITTHALGVLGMMVNGKLALGAAVLADAAFIPGDIVKNVFAVLVAVSLHKAFPDLLVRRRR